MSANTSAICKVAAVMNLHREGLLAHASISSYLQCCAAAEQAGYSVLKVAVLDRPDERTHAAVIHRKAFDQIEVVDFGDLGLSRNHGAVISDSEYVAYFDADDLWGDAWLKNAVEFCAALPEPERERVVCHPELIYWFTPLDMPTQAPSFAQNGSRSSYLRLIDSNAMGFDKSAILFANLYTSNSFASRVLYERHPYPAVDKTRGFGVEDWAWNALTLGAGIRHAAVPGAVHLVRHKPNGSLSTDNVRMGLLPPLHELSAALTD